MHVQQLPLFSPFHKGEGYFRENVRFLKYGYENAMHAIDRKGEKGCSIHNAQVQPTHHNISLLITP